MVDALAITGEERRGSLRKALGSWQQALIQRYLNGETRPLGSFPAEYIGRVKRTQGTETSKYLEEKKSTEIPQVVASERGAAGNF